jgi:ABC-type multidrug transport system fused ATPase/permease subunit
MNNQDIIASMNLTIQCSYCRGMVPAGEEECPRCGAPLDESLPTSHSQEEALQEFIESSHRKLITAGTSAAELAFGVGCTLEVLATIALMVIIFFAFTKTWTILVVILFMLTLISILISSLLANRARTATTRKTYEREVKPDIDRIITRYGMSRDQFNERVKEILPSDSPLLSDA